MKTLSRVSDWVSRWRWRLHLLFVFLIVVPIGLFVYSIGRVLNRQPDSQATTESIQIARVSATLLEEHFGQSTTFLESIATRRPFTEALRQNDLKLINWHLDKARGLRPDFSFISVFDPDAQCDRVLHLSRVYWVAALPTVIGTKGVSREWEPYVSEVYRTDVLVRNLVVAIAVPVQIPAGGRSAF